MLQHVSLPLQKELQIILGQLIPYINPNISVDAKMTTN